MLTSTRLLAPIIQPSDPVDLDGDWTDLVAALETYVAIVGFGTFANRPISTPGTPGITGRFYVVNSTDGGGVVAATYFDYGTGWLWLNPDQTPGADSITAAMIQAGAVGSSEIATDAVGADEILAGAVGTAEVNNLLKPSAGAGGATEALRALGTAAGTAAAGTHSPQHALAGADPLPADSVAASQIQAGAVAGAELATQVINTQAVSYTLALVDRFALVKMTPAGATTVYAPPDAIPFNIGDSVDLIQWGAGQITLTAGAGATLVGNPGLKLVGQYAMVTLIKMAANSWVAVGALTP